VEVRFHKDFKKGYSKLSLKQQEKVDQVLRWFRLNPYNPILKNHALKGDQEGNRAISAGGDLRLVFRQEGNYSDVLFILVGTHNQVY